MSRILPSILVLAFAVLVSVLCFSLVSATPSAIAVNSMKNNKELSDVDRQKIYAHAKATNIKKTLRLKANNNNKNKIVLNGIEQPTSQVIMISNYCSGNLFYDTWESDIAFGAFEVAPSTTITPGESATFSAVVFPGANGEEMNGNVWYYGDGYGINIEFALTQGEWELSVSYPTIADVGLIGAVEVGNRAFYNIITGKNPYNGTSQC